VGLRVTRSKMRRKPSSRSDIGSALLMIPMSSAEIARNLSVFGVSRGIGEPACRLIPARQPLPTLVKDEVGLDGCLPAFNFGPLLRHITHIRLTSDRLLNKCEQAPLPVGHECLEVVGSQ
jgi:hypothetical protein